MHRPCRRGGDGEAHHKKSAQNGRYALAPALAFPMGKAREGGFCTIRRICRGATCRRSLCFPLANFFEILYNRIDMTGGLASQKSFVSLFAAILISYALHGLTALYL